MTTYYSNTSYSGSRFPTGRPRRNPWLTFLKVVCWCLGILIVLAAIALWILTAYMSPERITRLIEEKSSEYLDAEIKLTGLDYKIWSSYPWLKFEVDSLTVISKSLDNLPEEVKETLPPNSDFLASVEKIKGKINIHSLFHDKIMLRDMEIEKPDLNIVMVSDSLGNYDIARQLPAIKKRPDIDISEIKVGAPVNFSFFSLPYATQGAVEVDDFYLTKNDDNLYKIGFKGVVSGRYQEYEFPDDIPVKFTTSIRPDLTNMEVNLQDFSLALAGLMFETDGEIIANLKGIDLRKANVNIRIEDIFTLLEYLPAQILRLIPVPEHLSGFLPVDITASLISPMYIDVRKFKEFTPSMLPPIKGEITVNDARLQFIPPGMKEVKAEDIYLEITGIYNPDDSINTMVEVKELRLHGEGISLDGNMRIDNLTGENQNLIANVSFSSPLMETLSYLMPKSGIKISGFLKGDVKFSGEVMNLGKSGMKNMNLAGAIESHSLKVNAGKNSVRMKNFKTDYQACIPSYPLKNYRGTKLGFDIHADTLGAKASGADILLSSMNFYLDALDTVSGIPDPSGDFSFKASGLSFSQGGTSFKAKDISLTGEGALNTGGQPSYTTVPATTGGDDALIASRVSHTPLVLEYDGGGILQTVMSMMNLNLDFGMQAASFSSPSYLYPVSFENLNVNTNLNKVTLSATQIKIARTSFGIKANMDGLSPFLTSYAATPLKAGAEIDFNDVDINQLSWGYYGALVAAGKDSVFYIPPMTPFTASDSVCVAIPRNIEAGISLKSKKAEYMGFQFSPLSTRIIVSDGAATLSNLTVGTPYCTAVVDWTYSTSLIDNIFMDLKAKVENFNFSSFYKVFPSLIEKARELQNFTGVLNADIGCRFTMFPSMFMNPESLAARFDVKGTDLQFARQGRIQRITHLMRIEGDEPIKIQNLNITGSFHDNLLQLDPFKIKFDDYQLGIAGVNNTAGDMYYHLALEKSPFHLPFGVSIFGKFSHPEIRLGGTGISDYKAEEISFNPDSKINVNIMAWLRNGWQMFIQEAAKYEQTHSK